MKNIVNFSEINMKSLPLVGGKNASLGEMMGALSSLKIKIPAGFAITTEAYWEFLRENNIENRLNAIMNKVDAENLADLKSASQAIKQLILQSHFSKEFENNIKNAFESFQLNDGKTVAVRSSATAEDLSDASFAGLQETYLNVSGIENVLTCIKKVYASLFNERAIAYRIHHKLKHEEVAISVGIQEMVRSDLGCSGVMFSIDTESGFDQVVFITGSYGLGESIVQGTISPDEFYVFKPTLSQGKKAILGRKLGQKTSKMIYGDSSDQPTQTVAVDKKMQNQFCVTDDDVLALAQMGVIIERHYGKAMDIEWAKDGVDGNIYIIQARPETVTEGKNKQYIETYHLEQKSTIIASGRSVGQKIGSGRAHHIQNPKEMMDFKEGEVLIADMTDPDWEPIMRRASAIVTNRGGRTCHAAIIAREMGTPAVVGCGDATNAIHDGDEITVSCAEGETGHIYSGLLKYTVEKTELSSLPTLSVKLCVNISNPDQAYSLHNLPNDGVGLARIEFIISNMIGIHPSAIINAKNNVPQDILEQIHQKTAAYASPREFYIEKLAEGIATIAAAFYPKQVIVRFSDFKSNEYANLLGGAQFEPFEENPMIGFRGGSRYVADAFTDSFLMECEAIKRVRETKGMVNVHIMFPFVRTVDEAKRLIVIAKKGGLERGVDDLKMFMMCEIPSNALLAEEFLQYFDGYSIGSNDLTQLTLGLDRDSEWVATLFDERNDAVKCLLRMAIKTCNQLNKYVGICGQGPSDHPDFAQWLMNEGIQSISLTPDTIIKTRIMLNNNESKKS